MGDVRATEALLGAGGDRNNEFWFKLAEMDAAELCAHAKALGIEPEELSVRLMEEALAELAELSVTGGRE